MGCFDSIWFECPRCGTAIEAQNKGGRCSLNNYTPYDAPTEVAAYVIGDTLLCPSEDCSGFYRIAGRVQLDLVPFSEHLSAFGEIVMTVKTSHVELPEKKR